MYILSIVYILAKVFSQLSACRLLCVDKFIGGFDQVLSDPALGDEVYDGEEEEGLAVRDGLCSKR